MAKQKANTAMNIQPEPANVSALSPGTAVYPKGRQKLQEILKVATEVLAFEGYSAFTMRNIASRLGITHRNLQYYFKTKSSLFQAVVEHMIELELKTAHEAVDSDYLNPEEKFSAFIRYSFRDNEIPLIRGFQFELWALATRDEFAAECRDRTTNAYCDFIVSLIAPLTPRLSKQERHSKAAIILSLLQGSPLITSLDGNGRQDMEKIEQSFLNEAFAILTSSGS